MVAMSNKTFMQKYKEEQARKVEQQRKEGAGVKKEVIGTVALSVFVIVLVYTLIRTPWPM